MKKKQKSKSIRVKAESMPEWTGADFVRARPARDVVPNIVAVYHRTRGRPPKAETKKPVSIRLSPHVLEHFKTSGPGWQTRLDEALQLLIGAH